MSHQGFSVNEQQGELLRIYQLSHLGLPSQLFVTVLLAELHRLLPSYSNSFVWSDNQGQISHIFDERHNLQFSYALHETENISLITDLNHWLINLGDVSESQDYLNEEPAITEIFKRLMLPLRYINSMFLPVRTANDGHCLGILILHRKKRRQHFTSQEKALCLSVLPLIEFGLKNASSKSLAVIDGWHQGLLVVDRHAYLQHACHEGKKLLSLALQQRTNQKKLPLLNNLQSFSGINDLIDQLLKGRDNLVDDHEAVLQTFSAWGEFRLTGFLIHDYQGQRSPNIGINICWQVPFLLKLFRGIPKLDLTPRQQTVALFYAAGYPTKIMADKLELSLYTVKEHIHNIFERLQIRSRSELIEQLICHQTTKAFKSQPY